MSTDENLLEHLISDEVGTSAFLATLLDKKNTGIVFEQARSAIAEVLNKRIADKLGNDDTDFLEAEPKVVRKEYLDIDLVVVWSPWTILIENKVAAASVTRGQLSDYYEKALRQIDNDKDKGEDEIVIANQPICFIYLTPTKNTGVAEFNSLALEPSRSDIQIHMEWKELLEPLRLLIGMSNSIAFSFLTAGINRVEKIIEDAKNGTLPDLDGRRDKIKALMNNLKERIQNGYEQTSGLVFCRWSDQRNEQLFARGPTRSAYVTLYVSYDRCKFPSEGSIQASGDISFEVARKHRTRLRGFLAGKPQEEWCKLLGIASIDTLDSEKGKLLWGFSLPEMPTEEFLLLIKERLLVFASVFREILVEAVDPKAIQANTINDVSPLPNQNQS